MTGRRLLSLLLRPWKWRSLPGFKKRIESAPSLSEGLVLQLRENDLGDCLDELSKRWFEEFQRKGLRFEAKFDPSIPTFRFDYQKVQQIVANLLDNALTHTPSGGSVTLNCMPQPNGVEVSVTGALEQDQKILDDYEAVSLSPPTNFRRISCDRTHNRQTPNSRTPWNNLGRSVAYGKQIRVFAADGSGIRENDFIVGAAIARQSFRGWRETRGK
jgi:hypothetical protein